MTRPQPTLRAVAQPDQVAQILGRALAAATSTPVRAVANDPARAADRPAAAAMA